MEYYLIFIILVTLAIINPKNKGSKNIIGILLGLFICTTYFNGSDWRQYELAYEFVTLDGILTTRYEKGYYLYMLLFKSLGINFYTFFIITKLFVFYIFNILIKKYSKNYYLGLCCFYVSISLYLFIDCPFRNLIAVGITLLGQKYLLENKYYKYIVVIIIASLFHKSALFCLGFILLQKVIKISEIKLLILLLLIFIIFMNQEILLKFFSKLPYFETKIQNYIGGVFGEQKLITLGSVEKIIFISIIILRKKILLNKYRNILIGAILYFIAYRMGNTFQVLSRLMTYMSIFYILGILFNIDKLKKDLKYLVIIILLLYQGTVLIKTIQNQYIYLPYTTYLTYIFKEKPSYYERYYYHINEFEKRTKKIKKVDKIEKFKNKVEYNITQ